VSEVKTNWAALHGDAFRGACVLVTGGAGFIGSHIAEALSSLGARVRVLDDLTGGDAGHVAQFPNVAFTEGSILDPALLLQLTGGCRWVFHQAALGSVPRSVEQPDRYLDVNVVGTQRVLEAARAAGVERVVFAASSSAYGDTPTLPKIEAMPASPRSPYAANKVACEALMQAWACSYGVDTASLRYFNIFGPRQNANSAYAAVIAAFAKALIAGEPCTIYGDGEQSRDFTFVHNAVHANLLAARCTRRIEGRPINVACGQRITVNQLEAAMRAQLAPHVAGPRHLPDRAGDVKHSLADLALARELIGYEPILSFEQGLAATSAWYQQVMSPV
jgi:nucleoside-diphosphate-sugar epimerase